jgi:ribosome-associated translation inhibitor RaiA
MEDNVLQLGGNIELSGFNELDGGIMMVLKKIVGNYARKMSDRSSNFEKLSLHVKKVHEKEKGKKYELHAQLLDNGKSMNASFTDRNLFVAVDSALKGIEKQMG